MPAGLSSALGSGIFASNDGDLVFVSGGVTDWNSFTSAPPTGFDDLTTVPDNAGKSDDMFNGGVKQDKECAGTKIGSLGGGDSKFDVHRLYLTHTVSSGVDYLFLAWERVPQNSTTASSHVAFEFNKGSVACNTTDNPLLERSEGDKLLVYDFEGGSAAPTLSLRSWVLTGACEVSSDVAPCWGPAATLNGTNSDAAVNIGGSVTDTIADPDETLGTVEFGEAAINLTNAVGADNICSFSGHVTGVSRSSGSSGTAQMKDKVGPAEFTLPGCVADTTITSNISLDDHASISGFDDKGAGDHSGSLTFTLYGPTDENCNSIVDSTEDDPDVIADVAVDPVYETTITNVDSGGPWSTADEDNTDSSYTVPTDDPGVYNWVVSYTGDTGNNPSSSQCGDEQATVDYGA